MRARKLLKRFSNGFGDPGRLNVWVRRTAKLCDKSL
jgi:hypothetical protein